MSEYITIEQALNYLKQGSMIILVDDEQRENEADLIIAAEKATPAAINFMIKHARGQLCLALNQQIVDRLQLPFMPQRNPLANQAAFTVSIEAATGIASGVSVYDRSHTIQVAVNPNSTPNDISTPGHIFPICARPGGVLERAGHTEGSTDLTQLAGLQPAAVICEIMNDDGTVARNQDLQAFAKLHDIKLVAINDLISYRQKHPTSL